MAELYDSRATLLTRPTLLVGPSGSVCNRCGAEKNRYKQWRFEKGKSKGWRYWLRCDACRERLEQQGTIEGKRRTVDGDEYNRLIKQFGGAKEYNEARKQALKSNPLLAALEFKACPKCGKCMSCDEEVRHDRGGVTRYRWRCDACRNDQIAACTRERKRGTRELTERGRLIVEQRGMTKAEKDRARRERERVKRVAAKGWSRQIRLKYGLTREQYVELLERQDYTCAMSGCNFKHRHEEWCSLPPRGQRAKGGAYAHQYLLCVDHCHETGQVRGLLCNRCNIALGHVEEMLRNGVHVLSLYRYQQDHLTRIGFGKPLVDAVLHSVDERYRDGAA